MKPMNLGSRITEETFVCEDATPGAILKRPTSINELRQSTSDATAERKGEPAKKRREIRSTEEGIQIDVREAIGEGA
jgi:hypothetical protein